MLVTDSLYKFLWYTAPKYERIKGHIKWISAHARQTMSPTPHRTKQNNLSSQPQLHRHPRSLALLLHHLRHQIQNPRHQLNRSHSLWIARSSKIKVVRLPRNHHLRRHPRNNRLHQPSQRAARILTLKKPCKPRLPPQQYRRLRPHPAR